MIVLRENDKWQIFNGSYVVTFGKCASIAKDPAINDDGELVQNRNENCEKILYKILHAKRERRPVNVRQNLCQQSWYGHFPHTYISCPSFFQRFFCCCGHKRNDRCKFSFVVPLKVLECVCVYASACVVSRDSRQVIVDSEWIHFIHLNKMFHIETRFFFASQAISELFFFCRVYFLFAFFGALLFAHRIGSIYPFPSTHTHTHTSYANMYKIYGVWRVDA